VQVLTEKEVSQSMQIKYLQLCSTYLSVNEESIAGYLENLLGVYKAFYRLEQGFSLQYECICAIMRKKQETPLIQHDFQISYTRGRIVNYDQTSSFRLSSQ
jgi:hypothetical protein